LPGRRDARSSDHSGRRAAGGVSGDCCRSRSRRRRATHGSVAMKAFATKAFATNAFGSNAFGSNAFGRNARASLVAIALLVAAGCSNRGDAIVVGGKNFTEQRVLGELVAQAIERSGLEAERKLDLGGTFVCDSALRAGQIDVYVEYTGT